ncbi:hypothetical protein HOS53_gp213 [Klebsiella phage May]|uniref:Uncharacterized protein n=1 Tax=Klebsiella phage May TaxID=2054272 RepID=A0A2H5BNN9_9CAUD|nr:hypothetical protein HOS53_gp213 [Klebsiella phage May]AUG87947.1 hypothetical protein CPT_May_032 [Klebsiella phage May]
MGTGEREGKHLSTRLHGLRKYVENNGSWGFDSLREHQICWTANMLWSTAGEMGSRDLNTASGAPK